MDSQKKFQVALPKDFSFEHTLSFLKRSPRELLHTVDGDKIYKGLKLKDHLCVFKIQYEQHALIVELLTATSNVAVHQSIENYIREWFDLETNLKPFYKFAETDALLKNLIKKYYGYRIIGQPDLFESITWAILGQQINLAFAYTLKERLVKNYGEALSIDNRSFYVFPTPKVLSEASTNDLLSLQFSKQKAQYVITVAQHFLDGTLSKEKIKSLPFEGAKKKLMEVKGIGNWTANYALMKTFRYPNAFPLEDAGVHNAIKNLKGMKTKPTLEQVKRIFKKYKGWEAYATLYLWKSL